jgi:hypothetical protein
VAESADHRPAVPEEMPYDPNFGQTPPFAENPWRSWSEGGSPSKPAGLQRGRSLQTISGGLDLGPPPSQPPAPQHEAERAPSVVRGLYSYGLYSYGLYSYGLIAMACIVMAYIVMACIVMAYILMACIVMA